MPMAVEPSNRTDILYALIKEFIKDGMRFLDIGCGHVDFQGTRLPGLIHENFRDTSYLGLDVEEKVIELNKEGYPYYDWLLQDAGKFIVDKQPDFVFHIGINKWWDESWKLHVSLHPKYALLEAGAPLKVGRSVHQDVFRRLKEMYLDRNYEVVQEGDYIWTAEVTQQLRTFAVLKEKPTAIRKVPKNVKFFFVIGTGCSATTWLYQTLQNIPETQVEMYWSGEKDLLEIGKAYNSEQDALRYIEDGRKRWMLSRLNPGIKIYGEVNGMVRWHCRALMKAFPGATFVQLVRDGRDWVRSMLARPNRFKPDPRVEDLATRYVRPKEGDECRERWNSMSRFEKICWEWARTNEYLRRCIGKKVVHMERMLTDFDYFRTYILAPLGLDISEELWIERIKIQGSPDKRVVMPLPSEWDDETLRQFNEICGDEMQACGYGGEL